MNLTKFQKLSPREVVLEMVAALREPSLPVWMGSFLGERNGKTCGCAAENFICRVTGKVPSEEMDLVERAKFFDVPQGEFDDIEIALDRLRCGRVGRYNIFATNAGMAQLRLPSTSLPELTTENYLDNLAAYEAFAMEQDNSR